MNSVADEALAETSEHQAEAQPSPNGSNGTERGRDSKASALQLITQVANRIAENRDADILLYNGVLARPYDQQFLELVAQGQRRPNVLLIIVTRGGDPDAAYRIARVLQRTYRWFICFISGYCKSAGTLVALGAHELVVTFLSMQRPRSKATEFGESEGDQDENHEGAELGLGEASAEARTEPLQASEASTSEAETAPNGQVEPSAKC